MPLFLETLQDAVRTRLAGLSVLDGVPLIARNETDAAQRIETAIQSGIGLAVLIEYPEPRTIDPDAPGPVFTAVAQRVRILENVYTNSAAANALSVAEAVAERLHLWKPRIERWHGRLVLGDGTPWRTVTDNRHPDRIEIEQRYLAMGALGKNPDYSQQ